MPGEGKQTDAHNKLPSDGLPSTSGFQSSRYEKLHQRTHTIHQRVGMTTEAARDSWQEKTLTNHSTAAF